MRCIVLLAYFRPAQNYDKKNIYIYILKYKKIKLYKLPKVPQKLHKKTISNLRNSFSQINVYTIKLSMTFQWTFKIVLIAMPFPGL